MTTYYSQKGTTAVPADWNDATAWNTIPGGGGSSGVPGTGDTAYVRHYVRVNQAITITKIYVTDSVPTGDVHLYQQYDITMDDATGAEIRVYATTGVEGFSTNGTRASPRLIKSANASPSNPWAFRIDAVLGEDNRTLNMRYLNLQGNKWFLGNQSYYLYFNDTTASEDQSNWMLAHIPLTRRPNIIENAIQGRTRGRVYHRSSAAGTVQLDGFVTWESHAFTTLLEMDESLMRVAFTSDKVHVPKAFIERARPRAVPGSLELGVSIGLIEAD